MDAKIKPNWELISAIKKFEELLEKSKHDPFLTVYKKDDKGRDIVDVRIWPDEILKAIKEVYKNELIPTQMEIGG